MPTFTNPHERIEQLMTERDALAAEKTFTDGRIAHLELTVKAKSARIRALEAELRDVLDWARTEKAPLRVGEIESIERVLGSVSETKGES